MTTRRPKSAPFGPRFKTALEVTKAAGAETFDWQLADGSRITVRFRPANAVSETNDFDRPPRPHVVKRG